MRIIDLKGEDYNKEKFKSVTRKNNPFFVFLNGHGEYDSTKGYNNEIIMKATENDELLKGRIAYLLSCRTGKILGPSAVKKGCFCFIGYDENFVIVTRRPLPENPLDDKFTEALMKASNQIPLNVIKGKSSMQAWINSQNVFNEWIEWWENQDTKEAPFIVRALIFNRDHQIFLKK